MIKTQKVTQVQRPFLKTTLIEGKGLGKGLGVSDLCLSKYVV